MADPIKPIDRPNVNYSPIIDTGKKPVDETTKNVAGSSLRQLAHTISSAFSRLKEHIFRFEPKMPPLPLPPQETDDAFFSGPLPELPEEEMPPPPPGPPPHPILQQQAGTLKRGYEIYVEGGEHQRVDDNFQPLDDATLAALDKLEKNEQELLNEASKKSADEAKFWAKFEKKRENYAPDAKAALDLINELHAKLAEKPTLFQRIANLFKFKSD